MPDWWEWELEITDHVEKRMVERQFSETDLRIMFTQKVGIRPDEDEPGRWIVEVRWEGDP